MPRYPGAPSLLGGAGPDVDDDSVFIPSGPSSPEAGRTPLRTPDVAAVFDPPPPARCRMSEYPAWMKPYAEDLDAAVTLGFSKWRYNTENPAASIAAFASREGDGYMDTLMFFRRVPDATCLGFRHGADDAPWWSQEHAIREGALKASRKTELVSLATALAEVKTWPVGT